MRSTNTVTELETGEQTTLSIALKEYQETLEKCEKALLAVHEAMKGAYKNE